MRRRLRRRPYSLLPERVPRVGATSALACRDQGTDASAVLITTALLSGPAAVLSAAQPTVPIANNRTSTDRRAQRAAISLFAQESATGPGVAGAGALKPPGTRRSANRSTGSRPVRLGQARVRVRPGTVRERAQRPRILSTSSQVPAPTKNSRLAARTRPRRLPADIFCRSFTKRSLDAGSDHTRGIR